MTSVERAQRFLQNKTRAIALTVISLASVAASVGSAAASTLSLTPSSCVETSSGGGTFVVDDPAGAASFLYRGPGIRSRRCCRPQALWHGIDDPSFDTYLTINITTQGDASGTAGVIPVYYDFTLSNTSSSLMSWDVYFAVSNDCQVGEDVQGTSTGGTITGSFTVDATDFGPVAGYVLHVEATDDFANDGDIFTLDVPPNSIDAAAAPTPEPASFSLFGLALAPLVWWNRRRTQQISGWLRPEAAARHPSAAAGSGKRRRPIDTYHRRNAGRLRLYCSSCGNHGHRARPKVRHAGLSRANGHRRSIFIPRKPNPAPDRTTFEHRYVRYRLLDVGPRDMNSWPKIHSHQFDLMFDEELRSFRPDILLGYGGLPVDSSRYERARRQGVKLVFALHNAGYLSSADFFRPFHAILTPSQYLSGVYLDALGVQSTPLPVPLNSKM